jgi:hypothetical protein
MRDGYDVYPLHIDELGRDVAADQPLRYHSLPGWVGDLELHCNDWTSGAADAPGLVGFGMRSPLISQAFSWCSAELPLFCFGVNNNAATRLTPTRGRRSFVTRADWRPIGGLTAADAQCQTEARAANLPGTFLAYLATTSAAAASRFDAAGPAWVRLDGAPLTRPGQLPGVGRFEVPPSLDAFGKRVAKSIWSGASAATAPGTLASTCRDWTTSDASASALFGALEHLDAEILFSPRAEPCSASRALLCLER